MKEQKTIEQLFQQGFDEFEVQPSDRVWKGVRTDLLVRNFLHFSPYSLNVWYVAGVVVVAAIVIISLGLPESANPKSAIQNPQSEIIIPEPSINNQISSQSATEPQASSAQPIQNPQSEITIPELSASNQNSSKSEITNTESKTNNSITPKSEIRNPKSEISPSPDKPSSTAKPNLKSEIANLNSDIPSSPASSYNDIPNQTLEPKTSNQTTETHTPLVFSWFTCSANSGCAPLSLSFQNFTENASRYFWTFGDGGSSELKNPSYIFDEPGTYFVSLTAYSASNEISIFTDTIQVNPLPEARFSMDVQGLAGEGQPVYFYNYSRGAESYSWDFGDGTGSTSKDPDHYFSKKVKTNIKLLAQSSAGCADSTILKDAFRTGEPALIFPTAFSPNTNGPGTGQYTLNNPENDVFYPFVEEDPTEYQLKIFNRSGIQVFESTDIQIGWDGYYKDELLQQGVYVWKARAKFADGRSVVRMGDVTLLWGQTK
jgi:PKD repeat protein